MPVTSINIAAPYWFDVTGGPITTSGTITIGLNTGLDPGLVLGSPVSGTGPLELRALSSGDLPIVSVTPGTYTNPSVTVDQYGRVVAVNSGNGPSSPGTGTITSITAMSPLTGGTITVSGTIGLDDSGVTPGSYTLPSLTVDTYGRITTISNGTAGTVTSVTSANGAATVANSTTTPVITIVSAPKWTTARNLAGNSTDGSANVTFANKFIVQGTVDSGLSAAQFLGALGTGIVKNTTTTGVLSIAIAADFPTLNQNTTGSAATLTTSRTIGGISFNGSANITVASATGGFTVSGGDLALGSNSITMSGSIGTTGTRVTKGWFTDLEITSTTIGSEFRATSAMYIGVNSTAIISILDNNSIRFGPTYNSANYGYLSFTGGGVIINSNNSILAFQTGSGITSFTGPVTLSNYTTDGFVKTSGSTGVLSIDTNTYITASNTVVLTNKTITKRVQTVPDASSITPGAFDIVKQINTQSVGTLTINSPLSTPPYTEGQELDIWITSTNAQTFSWGAIYVGCTTLPLPIGSTGGGKIDKFFFQYNLTTTKWELARANYGY